MTFIVRHWIPRVCIILVTWHSVLFVSRTQIAGIISVVILSLGSVIG